MDKWSSNCFSNEQQKCFDSSAPVSTVNVVQLAGLEMSEAPVDYNKHYDRERCGGTKASDTIFPFYKEVLPIHINSTNCQPRSSPWADDSPGGIEEDFWSLETSKLFGGRNKENDCGTFWDVDLLHEKAFKVDWNKLRGKLEKMKLGVYEIEHVGGIFAKHFRRLR